MTQKIWNIDLNQIIAQWFESTVDFVDLFGFSLNFVDLFWVFTEFRWPFLGFHSISLACFGAYTKFRWPIFGHSTKCLHSNQLMTQAESRRLESIQLMSQATSQELTQNQLMTQVDCQTDSWLKVLHHFRFKSTHDSTKKHLIISRIMIRLWVIPMSTQTT